MQVLFLVFLCVSLAHSLKILALFPYGGKSHMDVFLPLTKALARKGHDVTVISHFPLEKQIPHYTDIDLRDSLNLSDSQFVSVLTLDKFKTDTLSMLSATVLFLDELAQFYCQKDFQSPSLQEFMKKDHKFDVIILEYFNTDCFAGFVHKFKAPVIGISSCVMMPWTSERFGNPTHPAYIPNHFLDNSDKMDFLPRVVNFLGQIMHQAYYNYARMKNDYDIAKNHFSNLPSLKDIVFNSSLFLVNTHFSFNLPRPLVPSVIEVGGIHIGGMKKPPADLEKWINESTHGVIYFSLGSMIKGHTFPEEKRTEFLKAFRRLPQRVLWKYENDSMPGKPDNVMIRKWMPQLDILCHPNVKAFISHGGLLGTTEAVHCGVPTVVMPQFGDQHTNAKALEASGGGVILQLSEATEDNVYEALQKVLDPEFRKGAKELSERFRDRPLPPLETAIYWVEYVARHRGAHHMRTAAVDMPLYKYLLLDVIAFLILIAAIISAILFYVVRRMFRKLFPTQEKQKTN